MTPDSIKAISFTHQAVHIALNNLWTRKRPYRLCSDFLSCAAGLAGCLETISWVFQLATNTTDVAETALIVGTTAGVASFWTVRAMARGTENLVLAVVDRKQNEAIWHLIASNEELRADVIRRAALLRRDRWVHRALGFRTDF